MSSERRRSIWYRLYNGETAFDFVGRWRRWLTLSAVLILAGLASLGTRGLNLGLDFTGGSAWQVRAPDVSVGDARDALRPLGLAEAKIQIVGGDSLRVQADPEGRDKLEEVRDTLARLARARPGEVSVNDVGPSWGEDVTRKAQRALVFFLVAIAIYITLRFEWKMALATLAAMFHDILVTVGIYSLAGFEVTPATVIAFLTILGYSIYDGIVVFDKIEENTRGLASSGRLTYADSVNLSLNQVLMRTLNTSITALLPIASLLVVGSFLLGATTLQEFALALLVGLGASAYSSIFVASPLLAWLKEREPRYAAIRQRLAARGATAGPPLTPAAAAADPALAPTPATVDGVGEGAAPAVGTGVSRSPASTRPSRPSSVRPPPGRPAPRPRKKKRR